MESFEIPHDVARRLFEEAERMGTGSIGEYLRRFVLDEQVRREGSRRELLLRRAEEVNILYVPKRWDWELAVENGFTPVADWLVHTGRPALLVIDNDAAIIVQSLQGFRLARRWFDLARHFLANP